MLLRMLSKEVDDVMVQKLKPLDVLTSRVPHCSMPAPEAVQVKVTTAYMFNPEVASAYVMASLDARQALGLADCSTGPEVRIFDHLWRKKDMMESHPQTQGFEGNWGLVADNNPQWPNVLHVDQWCDAQHVQRQGVAAVRNLQVMSNQDAGRLIWPINLDPGRGSTSSATSSTAKDAGTSSMTPPSAPSSALSKAGAAGSATSSQGSTAGQAPAAKGPPAPKIGGTPTVQGPPVRPSSDSAVMAKAGTTDPQAKGPLKGQFPTPAESVGKSAPVNKPPPTGKPKPRASSLSLKAAYASMSSTTAPGTGVSPPTAASPRGPATTATGTRQPAQSPPSKEATKTLEEKGEEMMKKKQEEKDPGKSYTTMVMESLRDQSGPPKGLSADSWEEKKKAQQTAAKP